MKVHIAKNSEYTHCGLHMDKRIMSSKEMAKKLDYKIVCKSCQMGAGLRAYFLRTELTRVIPRREGNDGT